MKPIFLYDPETAPLLAFGAHPDDIEYGCGGVVARETRDGRRAHFVVCSQGEASTHGTPAERVVEAQKAASILGATVEFIRLDGDAHLEIKTVHAMTLAAVIRRVRPAILLAPSLVENQHPDHSRLGFLVRNAARLARYGGVKELRPSPPHPIDQLLYYAVTPEAEPKDLARLLIDISEQGVFDTWVSAMQAHSSQSQTRSYVELQVTRARLNGMRAGIEYAMALFPNDSLILESLAPLSRGARRF